MKIYLAGEREVESGASDEFTAYRKLLQKNIKRRLFSFFYHGFSGGAKKKHDVNGLSPAVAFSVEAGFELFLDSGAFTAFTKGAVISHEEYADFVNRTGKFWFTCSSLDAIGRGEEAAQASWDNLKRLESLGAKVQPVFHVREPDHWLQRYVDEGYDYIFIGGMVPETTRWLLDRLDGLWANILTHKDGTPRVRIHGFGLTDQKLMFRYPWYSVDSSSWLMTGIFGSCLIRRPDQRKLLKVVFSNESEKDLRNAESWHYFRLPKPQQRVVDELLEPYGVTAEQCAARYTYRDIVNAGTFQGLEDMGATHFTPVQETLF